MHRNRALMCVLQTHCGCVCETNDGVDLKPIYFQASLFLVSIGSFLVVYFFFDQNSER
jgi:hypothetical protein